MVDGNTNTEGTPRVARTCFLRSAAISPQAAALQTRSALRTFSFFAMVLVAIAAQSVSTYSQTHSTIAPNQASQHSKSALRQGPPAPALPAPPTSPFAPASSDKPVIIYEDGKLTIEAHNSTLADILRAVSKKTGAVMDFPPEANQPVVGRMGPGPVVEVLDRLLKPLSFNYAILGSAAEPNAPVRVILSAKPGGPAPAKPAQAEEPVPGAELAQANAGSSTVATEQGAGEDPARQRWLGIQQDLMRRLNARGAPPDEVPQDEAEQPPQ